MTCSEFISIVLAPAPFFRCWYWTQVLCMLGKDSATLLQWSQLLWEELLSSLLTGLLSLLGRNLFEIGYWHISVSMTSIPGNTAIIIFLFLPLSEWAFDKWATIRRSGYPVAAVPQIKVKPPSYEKWLGRSRENTLWTTLAKSLSCAIGSWGRMRNMEILFALRR